LNGQVLYVVCENSELCGDPMRLTAVEWRCALMAS
jgi:hypothetical protein